MHARDDHPRRDTSGEPVCIIGAGMAGLTAAVRLHEAGVPVVVLEACDHIGGRVSSSMVDGFVLDRGFQVYLDRYPEASRVLDHTKLDLHAFYPGALTRTGGTLRRIADPWRRPIDALGSLFPPIVPLRDIPRIATLRAMARRQGPKGETTAHLLARMGISDDAMTRFFRPFFAGVFLEHELETPATMFRFVFGMFAKGRATLPAGGMGRIPAQLAARLPADAVRTGRRVLAVDRDDHGFIAAVEGGVRVRTSAVIVATDAPVSGVNAHDLAEDLAWNSTATLYFAAETAPVDEPILVLNGTGDGGPINHMCVPSGVAPSYAPAGAELISATTVGAPQVDDRALETATRDQMRNWFGATVHDWRLLGVRRIVRGLPRHFAAGGGLEASERLSPGVYRCGDMLENPSINGAMVSGRRAADALLADRRAHAAKA